MDRTIGKSENRNNDGERLMISLLEIAKSINEVDDDKIIKYKDKDGESQEMTAGAAKKMDKDHPAKQAWDKMNTKEKGDDGSEKDDDDKLGGSDFDRDGGVQIKKDRDDRDDWYAHMAKIMQQQPTDKPKSDDSLKDFEKHLDAASDYEDWYDENSRDLNLDNSEKEELEDLLQNWKYTEDDIQQAMAMGNDDDEDRLRDEIEDIRDKVKDLTSKAVSGDDSDDNAESDDVEISDANSGPIDRDDILDMLKNDSEIMDKIGGDDIYWDGLDLVSSKFDDATVAYIPDDANMTLGDLKKQIMDFEDEEDMDETITINGQKYRAIKEEQKKSNPRILKEIYDRTFRSLK